MDAESGVFFEEDFVGALGEEFGERRETFVDEDDLALVLIHEGAHGAVGVFVIDKKAGDNEIDFGEVELFIATGK